MDVNCKTFLQQRQLDGAGNNLRMDVNCKTSYGAIIHHKSCNNLRMDVNCKDKPHAVQLADFA